MPLLRTRLLPWLVLLSCAACSPPPPPRCVPGMTTTCACAGGRSGVQACRADGTYGACECSLGDGGSDTPPPRDVAVDAVADTPSAFDAVEDNAESGTSIDALDAPVDRADDATGGSDASTPTDARAADGSVTPVERTLPWRAGSCTFWTQNPPAVSYLPPLPRPDGLWAASSGSQLMMRQSPTGWVMAMSPEDGLGPFDYLDEYAGMMLAGSGERAWVRMGATWFDLAGPPWNAPRGRPLVLHGDLYIRTDTTLYRYDAGTWTELGLARGSLAGGRSGLYAGGIGLRYYDGTRWVDVTTPSPGGVEVASTSPTEVYAVNGNRLYRVSGTTLTPEPTGVACAGGAPPMVFGLWTGPGRLLIQTTCEVTSPRHYRLHTGATWSVIPDVPGVVPGVTSVRIAGTGEIYTRTLHRLTPSGWVSLVETPMPRLRVMGRAPGEIYSYGAAGLARLTTDRWEPVAATSALDVRSAVQTADGTIFMTVAAAPNIEVWRLRGTTLTRDFVVTTTMPLAFGGAGLLLARGVDDVYMQADAQLYRWNGAAWSTYGPPACVAPNEVILQFAFVGSNRLIAMCLHTRTLHYGPMMEFDGTSWTRLSETTWDLTAVQFYQIGPLTSASVVTRDAFGPVLRSAAGFSRWTWPTPMDFHAALGFSPTQLMAFFRTRVGFSDGTAPWRMVSIEPFSLDDGSRWTDGRFLAARARALSARTSTGPSYSIEGLVHCDLGP